MRSPFLHACALVCTFAAIGSGRADWQVAQSQKEASPNELVEHWQTMVVDEARGTRSTLHLAVFASRNATLQVIDQPHAPRRDLGEVMAQIRALAGVNGGYFDPADAPLGLRINDGRVLSPLRKAALLTGVLYASATRTDIVRASRFTMSAKIRAALQCGPLLVEQARPVAGLNATRQARRTFAAVDGQGRAAIGVSSSVSLADLGKILSLRKVAGQMSIARALNLDGGSSSAFWFAGREKVVSLSELKTVRDFVAIVPRSDR